MSDPGYVECAFMIPLVRNGDKQPHPKTAWRQFQKELYALFAGLTGPERMFRVPGPIPGSYTDRAGGRVNDLSTRFTVALPASRLDELRDFLGRACRTFDQEAIYLSIAGHVEFVRRQDGETEA